MSALLRINNPVMNLHRIIYRVKTATNGKPRDAKYAVVPSTPINLFSPAGKNNAAIAMRPSRFKVLS